MLLAPALVSAQSSAPIQFAFLPLPPGCVQFGRSGAPTLDKCEAMLIWEIKTHMNETVPDTWGYKNDCTFASALSNPSCATSFIETEGPSLTLDQASVLWEGLYYYRLECLPGNGNMFDCDAAARGVASGRLRLLGFETTSGPPAIKRAGGSGG